MRKEIEMMRVLRVPPLGKLVIESQGDRYETVADITHAQLKQRVLAAIGELIDFVGGYQKLVDAGVAPQMLPVEAPATMPAAEPAPGDDSLTPTQQRFLDQLTAERDALRAAVSKQPPPVVVPEVRAAPPPPEPAETPSIAEQIDRILQRHVSANPDLAGQKIRLHQNLAGGLQIEVNGRMYSRPREIQDPAVQRAIKLALQEWDAS